MKIAFTLNTNNERKKPAAVEMSIRMFSQYKKVSKKDSPFIKISHAILAGNPFSSSKERQWRIMDGGRLPVVGKIFSRKGERTYMECTTKKKYIN